MRVLCMSFHLLDYLFCILVLRVCVIRSSSCFLVPVSCSYGYIPFLVFLSLSSKSGLCIFIYLCLLVFLVLSLWLPLSVLVSPCLLFMVVCFSVLILDLTFWFRPYFRVLANYPLAFCFCTSDYLDHDPCLSVYDLCLVPLNLFICALCVWVLTHFHPHHRTLQLDLLSPLLL